MKLKLSDKLEEGRVRVGRYASDSSLGPVGAFIVIGPNGTELFIMASDGTGDNVTAGWEHVSVSLKHRTPNWGEMSWVKHQFWDDDEWVVQYHPAKGNHINHHEHCLHMWRHPVLMFPTPPAILV